jgi:uroporphyrinogen-III synthase
MGIEPPRQPPLTGRRVALTGAAGRDAGLADAIAAVGGIAREYPLIAFTPAPAGGPLDRALVGLSRYDWILFTSATAPAFVAERLAAVGAPTALPRIAAVGPSTARAVEAHFATPDFVAETHTAGAMADELIAAGVRGRLLFPAADIASSDLAERLRAAGAEVEMVTAYRTGPGDGGPALAAAIDDGELDVVLLASPSAARGLTDAVKARGRRSAADRMPAIVCIGPSTAAAARTIGLDVAAVAADHTREGLLHALIGWLEHHPGSSHASV